MRFMYVFYSLFFVFYLVSCADTPSDSLDGKEGYQCKTGNECNVGLICINDKCKKDVCFGISCDEWKECSQETKECVLKENRCTTNNDCLNNEDGKNICDMNNHECIQEVVKCTTEDEKRCNITKDAIETCTSGEWVSVSCNTGEECVIDENIPTCKNFECTEGTKRCSASKKEIEVCKSSGNGWDDFKICGAQEECTNNAGVFSCSSCNECDPNSFVATCENNGATSCDLVDGCYKEVQVSCLIGELCKTDGSVATCECKNDCTEEVGATCSADNSDIMICEKNANNCFYKKAELICNTDEECVVDIQNHTASCECVSECIPNSKKCTEDGTKVIECERNGNNGCYYWGTPSETCGLGSVCNDHEDNTASCDCTNDCNELNKLSCSDNLQAIEQCLKNPTNGCFYKAMLDTCDYGLACSQAEGENPTCDEACTNECINGQETCSEDKNNVLRCMRGDYYYDGNTRVYCYYWNSSNYCYNTKECIVASPTSAYCGSPDVCTTNEKRCSEDKTKVEVCEYNSWHVETTCSEGDICAENGDIAACEVEKKKAGEECSSNNECEGNRWCLGGEDMPHYCFTECYAESDVDNDFCGGESCVALEGVSNKFYCKQIPSRDVYEDCNSGNTCLNGAWCLSVGEKSSCFTSCNISDTTCSDDETCTPLATGASFCKPTCLNNSECGVEEICDQVLYKCLRNACNSNSDCENNPNGKIVCIENACAAPIEVVHCTEDGDECIHNTNEKIICRNSRCTERVEVSVCATTDDCKDNTDGKVVCINDLCVAPQ